MSDSEKYINEMARHLLNSNLALFIGAGFSKVFGYPSWGELLKSIIDEYELNGKLKSTNLFSFVNRDEFNNFEDINNVILDKLLGVDYLKLAGYVNHILEVENGISIHTAVGEKITKYEELRRKTDEIQKIIDFFQKRKAYLDDIITTNYDTNIEYCFNFDVSTIHRNLTSLNSIANKNKVFKIHGCINDIEENSAGIIITEKDYNNFKNKNKYLFYKIYSFFTEKKIVFIGYSINDPNIRSLLNDVIEENEGKVGLQIYWVTRDKLKKLDKEYYEKHFKLKIIESMEVVDFFNLLDYRIKKNEDLKEVVNAEIEEYTKAFIYNYTDEAFLNDIFEQNKVNDVLQYLYNLLVGEYYLNVINPYFILLTNSKQETIKNNRLSIQNVLELQNDRLFSLIELMSKDDMVKSFLVNNGFSDIYIDSLIEYASGHHSFGDYARSIRYLLKAYELFKDEVNQKSDEFIEALVSNITISCSDSNKYYGYDWRGLGEVKENINKLDIVDINKLIDKLERDFYGEVRSLQMKYVVTYSSLNENEKSVVLYEKLYKKQIKKEIQTAISRLIRTKIIKKFAFEKTEDDKLINGDIEIRYKIEPENENSIKYTLYNELNFEGILVIMQQFNKGVFEISINDELLRYNEYNEFIANLDIFVSSIESIIDEYMLNNGIEPVAENEDDEVNLDIL